jgi:hypothetical protein
MSTLQFSLFFASLLVGYLLIHLRLVRFESYLKEMAGLKTLNDRLKGVAESVERVRIDRIEGQLGQLHDDLVGLLDQLGRLERTLHQDLAQAVLPAPAAVPAAEPQAAGAASAGERIRAEVAARLLQLGYRELRILSDLSAVRLEDRVEVKVEATRQHMPVKGSVTVRNGGVVDVGLQTAAQSFP